MSNDESLRVDGDLEKVDVVKSDSASDTTDPDAGLSAEEREKIDKALLRKLDWYLIPWLSLLYLVSFIDRANIGNAKIEGIVDDLNMSENEFNNTLTIFFVSYALFEPLSNILLKRLRPRIYIPCIMLGISLFFVPSGKRQTDSLTAWGVVMTLMGLVTNYNGLMAARWFLGMTEAGLFPGVNYYLSCWYKRSEFGLRAAVFFSAAAVSGSFGGLLAAAISQMDGIGGKPGWAWIFILEGLLTVVIGVISFWMVHDFPDTATFLSVEDRHRVHKRLSEDNQASARGEDFQMEYFWQSVKDPKTYMGALIYMGVLGPLYAFSMFLPTIIRELGHKSTKAQLLSVPPYAVACVITILVGWVADRMKMRGVFNMGISVFGILGFGLLIGSTNPKLSYAATFFGALGIYPGIANTITWVSNNVEGVYKRGVSLGFVIGWGNLNGVVSSNIFRSKDAPHYRMGHAILVAYLAIGLLGGSILNYIYLRQENKNRREGKRDYLTEGKTQEEIARLGDVNPEFMYTL
ncbi:retrograde regulation protein 2 [Ascodesmis nigricans]|uniref:Retrograde regulation protein 2 n=1 Tax=Ascodesmis nigricans TaxID=341454 RepID=A0A4S2MML5_9PEZI|nr:retrograde regulation protein 2 [Ascodesmis nigricans]